MEINEIHEWKEYLVNNRHAERVNQQEIDQEFLEDVFEIPNIKNKDYKVRTGFVAEMANGFTQQLVAATPKVYTTPKEKSGRITKEVEEASKRIAKIGNKWTYQLGKWSHNPFKQTFKHIAFGRGEAWIYIPHRPELAKWKGDESWQSLYPNMIPVRFLIYDPLVVFSDPSEDIDGDPSRVLVTYKRHASDIASSYPYWTKAEQYKGQERVDFLLYCDRNTVYAEADGEPLFRDSKGRYSNGDGRRKNVYKTLPFAHVYSGWGQETSDKKPELLAFSRTRMIRDKVAEDAAMASDFRYNIHAYAWKHRTLTNRSGMDLGEDTFKEYHPNEPGKLSVLTLPAGADMDVEETQLFDGQVFAYRQQVRADLAMAYPAPLRGIASGESGRQEDILSSAGLALYDCAVENNSQLWAKAFQVALEICYEMPDMLPPTLQQGDRESYSELRVDTAKENPLDAIRKSREGHLMYKDGTISLETNLVKYQGFTQEEADVEMARLLVDDVKRNHPVFRQLMGMSLAQEMGVGDVFQQLSEQEEVPPMNPPANRGAQGGPPAMGNIRTPRGMEMADESRTHELRV